jgi:hypothetical protein
MKQPLIFLIIIILLIGSFYLALTRSSLIEMPTPSISAPTITPTPALIIDSTANWSILNVNDIGYTVKYPSSVLIKSSSEALTTNNLTSLESWYLSLFSNHTKTFVQEMDGNPGLNSTRLLGRQIISVGSTSSSAIYSINNYFFTPGQINTLRITYGPQPAGISPEFGNQTFELNRQILSTLHFDTQASVNSDTAIEIVSQIPEIKSEINYLSKNNVKTVLYAESQPSETDSTYTIYFGENYPDHNVRLATVIVDSFSGQIAFKDYLDDTDLTYKEWQKTCSLQSCKK